MTFITKAPLDSYRVHSALGAINELAFQIAIQGAKAIVSDAFGLHAERGTEAIQRMRAQLDALEAALAGLPEAAPICRDFIAAATMSAAREGRFQSNGDA